VGGLFSGKTRMIVTRVIGGKAKAAQIRRGDMIRAVSMPEEGSSASIWPTGSWQLFGVAAPQSEEGMAMLDNTEGAAYEAAINANVRANGPKAKVVLLIERPVADQDSIDDWFKPGRQGVHAAIQSLLPNGGGEGNLPGALASDRLK